MTKLCILIALLCALIQGQKSPCPQYFTYEIDRITKEMIGQIVIPSPPKVSELKLEIVLDITAQLPSNYIGRLKLARSKEESAEDVYHGRNLFYHVYFPIHHPIPLLSKIRFNGEQYCSSDKVIEDYYYLTTITLEHTLCLPLYQRQLPITPFRTSCSRPTNTNPPSRTSGPPPMYTNPPFQTSRPPPVHTNSPSQTSSPPSIRITPSYKTSSPLPIWTTPSYKTSSPPPMQTNTPYPISSPPPTWTTPPYPISSPPPIWTTPPYETSSPPPMQTNTPYPISSPPPIQNTQKEITTCPSVTQETESNIFISLWDKSQRPTQNPRPSPSPIPIPPIIKNICGTFERDDFKHPLTNTNRLVAGGQMTMRGDWPWVAALFVIEGTKYEFQCAGTILTRKHVLTAAHCLKKSIDSNEDIHPNLLEVALGRFQLKNFLETGTINRHVESYIIHDNYIHSVTGDSDLAILILRKSVEYSSLIRPICLWPQESTDLQNVVNRDGFVVGWGKDEHNNPYTNEPWMVTMPIISMEDCHWSHPDFVKFTTKRTFCAGMRNGSGPCNGDSGSGLVLYDVNGSKRYHLRGVVSRSLRGNDTYPCDLKNYIVFVDVAKYLPWIQRHTYT